MSLAFQASFTNKNSSYSLAPLSSTHLLKPPISQFSRPNSTPYFLNYTLFLTTQHRISPLNRINASFDDSSINSDFNFDSFLSVVEFVTLASSAAISLYVAVRYGVLSKGGIGIAGWLSSRVFVWQCVFLVAGVSVGAAIRRRQWRRVFSRGAASNGADYLGRVEKLEEGLRSSATLIRVLSRQLEKVGVRVRATRKALKEPISETAGVAQKNSEATRALAAQGDILVKEVGEIQKVLLAMQEQQQKQLELILAIGKAANLLNTPHTPTKHHKPSVAVDTQPSLQINQNDTLNVAHDGP